MTPWVPIKKVMHRIISCDSEGYPNAWYLRTRTPQWLWWDTAWEVWVEPCYFKSPYTTPLRIFRW